MLNSITNRTTYSCLLILLFALISSSFPAQATDSYSLRLDPALKNSELHLAVGKSKLVTSPAHIKEIIIGTADIADVKLLNSRTVLVLGKATGYTNIAFRDKHDELIALLDITVGYDIEAIKFKMHQLLPDENDIQVRSANSTVILSGKVTHALAMDTALVVARSFAGQNVTNLLQVGGNGQQVLLEVRIAEVERSSIKGLGVNATFANGALTGSLTGPVTGAFGSIGVISRGLNLQLQALENRGLARVLAEPNLVALSGQEGSFLAGGEFPVTVLDTNGQPSTEFKEFGVGLKFTPTVLASHKINLRTQAEVSSITTPPTGTGANFALKTRRTHTTVEVGDGQSFAIAGLIQSDINNAVDKLPGLGSLPVLGALFRSSRFQRNETELVILITPRLVKPMPSGSAVLPTDNFVPPSDVDQYLNGQLQGTPKAPASPAPQALPTSPGGGMDGAFGHQL